MLKARYRRILRFFAGSLLNIFWWDLILPPIGFAKLARRTRERRLRRIASRYRVLAVQLGGVMIKIGQWLSTRLDVLPSAITEELAGLQDEVAAETFDAIRSVIESEFGQPLESVFFQFDPKPVAAASIGQVHYAHLSIESEGLAAPVIVKVQRPNIEALIETDQAALSVVSRWLQLYKPIRQRVNLPALINEFNRTLSEEVDYFHEGQNANTFAGNFFGDKVVRVPQVIWTHTTRRVLTLENVEGIKITDYAAMDAAGIDRKKVAKQLFDAYLKQIFDDHFFHADPHPGNLFVLPQPPEDAPGDDQGVNWQVVFVDFGMTGQVTPNVVAGLRELVFAVAERDGNRVIKAYQLMGVLVPNADLDLLRQANQRAFERFWGLTTPELMALRQTEAVEFVSEFRELIFSAPFQLPSNLILLGRCLTILNGICTGLDPDFNVWLLVLPWAEKLIKGEDGHQVEAILKEAAAALTSLALLPGKAEALMTRIEQGKIEVRTPEVRRQLDQINRSVRSLGSALIFAAMLLAAVQLFIGGAETYALILAIASGLFLIIFLLKH